MKVILFQSVENVGLGGDVANVKAGYFRNYLGPRGLAVEATDGNLKQLELKRKRLQAEAIKLVESSKQVGDRLKAVSMTFTLKAGENNRLFGSVTAADVADKLAELGFDIEKRKVSLPPIKATGTYPAKVKLQGNVTATVSVIVEREGGEEPEPERRRAKREDDEEGAEAAAGETPEAETESE